MTLLATTRGTLHLMSENNHFPAKLTMTLGAVKTRQEGGESLVWMDERAMTMASCHNHVHGRPACFPPWHVANKFQLLLAFRVASDLFAVFYILFNRDNVVLLVS